MFSEPAELVTHVPGLICYRSVRLFKMRLKFGWPQEWKRARNTASDLYAAVLPTEIKNR
jgi:hypothetical protein